MGMGHIHLYGSNVNEMLVFYRDIIGFAEGIYMPSFQMGDVGLTKEKNHVVAFNAWKRTNIPSPKDAAGLDYYTLVIKGDLAYNALIERLNSNKVEILSIDGETFILDPSKIKIKLEKI